MSFDFDFMWLSIGAYVFGERSKTPSELLSENKRTMDRAVRELDREMALVRRDEKRLMQDIQKVAQLGNMSLVTIMAKDLVRKRQCVEKFHTAKVQIEGVKTTLISTKSAASMAETMAKATKTMCALSRHVNVPSMRKLMIEFSKQNALSEQTSEMMNDATDDVFNDETTEEENAVLVNQIIDQVSCAVETEFASVPKHAWRDVGDARKESSVRHDTSKAASLDTSRKPGE